LIFLLFEVELVFLFPWATVFADKELIQQTNRAWGWFSMMEMVVFILVLALGLAYAWVHGFLDWVKSAPRKPSYKSPVPPELYQQINERYNR
jgi:NADH-quinone oxidoreductase subunit A